MRRTLALLIVTVVMMLSGSAKADDQKKEWYGAPIALADFASTLALVPAGVAAAEGRLAPEVFVGAGMFMVGGPIIHILHRQYAKAGASAALRLLPTIGLLAVASRDKPTRRCLSNPSGEAGQCDLYSEAGWGDGLAAVAGLALSALGAIAVSGIDSAALAWRPAVSVTSNSATLGASARF